MNREEKFKLENRLKESEEVVYSFLCSAGGCIRIAFYGMFENVTCLVPREPEYKAVDHFIDNVFFKGYTAPRYTLNHTKPFKYLLEEHTSPTGDYVKNAVFKAYKYAMKVYEWCQKNDKTIPDFIRELNADDKYCTTMWDFQIEKFFEEKKEPEKELEKDSPKKVDSKK